MIRSIGERVRLSRFTKALRALQGKYYDSDKKNDATVAEYIRLLALAREENLRIERRQLHETGVIALHMGSGGHHIEHWCNIDLNLDGSVDVLANLTGRLPFRSESVSFIHTEDFLEHIERLQADEFVSEVHRVLRPLGVVRVVTPDLRAIVKEVYLQPDKRHLRWCGRELAVDTPCTALNALLRMNQDHKFVYDHKELDRLLQKHGFETETVSWNRSRHPELRFLDLRNFGLSLYMEATKRQ